MKLVGIEVTGSVASGTRIIAAATTDFPSRLDFP